MAISFNIPTNAYSSSSQYSGMGAPWQNFSQGTAMPVIGNLLKNWPGTVNQAYSGATEGMKEFAGSQMMPAMQDVINNLAGRNILNSSVASDTLSKAGTDIIGKLMGYQSQLGMNQANAMMQLPQFASDVAKMGQYSTAKSSDPGEPYRAMLQAITQLMG